MITLVILIIYPPYFQLNITLKPIFLSLTMREVLIDYVGGWRGRLKESKPRLKQRRPRSIKKRSVVMNYKKLGKDNEKKRQK